MPQKKMMIGLPLALLLGVSAFAIGVIPGVRGWIDQTVPWLGINGPRTTKQVSVSEELSNKEAVGDSVPGHEPVASLDGFSPAMEYAKPQFEVQFAQATLPIAPKPRTSGLGDDASINLSARLAQTPSFTSVPPAGLNVPSSGGGTLIVENAQVLFPDDSTVAAQAEGIIAKLFVDDGTMINAGSPMIEIDPRLAEAEVEVSEKELEAAEIKAKDDSNLKYSEAALEVAIKELQISNDLLLKNAEDYLANEKKRLENKKALFQVNVSKSEKKRDEADLGVKNAKLKAAKIQVDLRKITAQRTGMVSEVAKRQFDFVRLGEIILKLTSMERLRITGNAKVTDSPNLLYNAPARVTIYYAEGKGETVEGIVGYVSPRSMGINTYKIHVDVPNRLTPDGHYLFREGMQATIEVMPRTR